MRTRSYRIYLLSAADHIRSVEVVEVPDDPTACLEAERILKHSEFSSVEVWEAERLVWHSDQDNRAARRSG